MVKKFLAVLGLVILPAALPAPALAQDAKTFLATVAKAMGQGFSGRNVDT